MASPSSTAAGSGTNPPTTLGDSTNTLNVQDLEEEVVHLREKQAEMEQKVDEANHRLAITLREVTSLRQVVEAMWEQLFPTPSHLQCPASQQAFAPTQPASDSTCPEVLQCAHPSLPSLLALVPTTMLEEMVSSSNPSQHGSSKPTGTHGMQVALCNNASSLEVATPGLVDERGAIKPTGDSFDWAPPKGKSVNYQAMCYRSQDCVVDSDL